jgi:hypothetical protein
MRLRSLVVCLVIVAAVGAACGDDAAPVEPGATSPAPTALPSVATEAPPSEPAGATSPDDAALGLYNAWLEGDADAAVAFATPQAIAELFAHPGNEIQFNSCSQTGSKYRCFFYYEGGGLNMNVEGSVTTGYLVTKAFFIAD